MVRPRAILASVDRYVQLAGRSCCAGRSWVGLDRTLARHRDDTADACDPGPPVVGGPDPVLDETPVEFTSAQRH